MTLSAADLQRRHELEGAPDPFPSLIDQSNISRAPVLAAPDLDTGSESAFPSLASSTPAVANVIKPLWGASSGPRIKPMVIKPVFTDSFTLSAMDLSNTGKDGKPATLGEVMKQVMTKYKVKVEASANQKARQTTFHIKADTQKELDKAKRSLLALLSPVITITIQAPATTIGSIIGPKGTTLKQIRDQTSVRVDIPPRDSLVARTNGPVSGEATPSSLNDDDEPTIPVTLTGPQPLVYEAQDLLNDIISSIKSTQRVRDIPSNVLPFVIARRPAFLAAGEGRDLNLALNVPAREITISGDRTAVVSVVKVIRNTIEDLKSGLTSFKFSLPKRQHRLLVGKALDEIMVKSRCSVVVPDHDDSSDEVIVWGTSTDLQKGISAVMEQANSQYIHEFPLPGPVATSRQILTYMLHIQYSNVLTGALPGISVYLPTSAAIEKGQNLNLDLVGDKSLVDAGVRKISELIGKLIGATREVSIDWLVHRVVIGKNSKKLKQYPDVHNIQIIFPNESSEKSSVVLVYDPLSSSASPLLDEKKRHLDEVEKELLELAKDAADVKSEKVSVEVRWHDAVVGPGGTTLNMLIGEDRTLSIKVGADAGDPSTQDLILVRGASTDVDNAVREILKIVEHAKNNEIVNSYSTEFDIDKEFVGRIVGAGGAGVNKLREQLGVRVDVSDDVGEKEKEGSRKKKVVHQKSRVKITGRQENAEEAKRRILNQLERLADETSEILKISSQYHSSLIGQNGKYAIRLEEKYSVKITFPRQSGENGESRTREQLKSDEVLIKGGKKGVAGAKSELLDAVEFEKEVNNILKFTVPNRTVARILGKGGVSINEIKDATEAQIDVERPENGELVTTITVRGTKKAIAAAKAAILVIADQVAEELTITMTVESKFHGTLIGAGGQGLRELVTNCGGPSDPKLQAGLIRFPRQGEPSDEVKLRGEPKLVNKLKAELEKAVATLRDRVILAVEIPAVQHRALIGRGGQHLNDMQNKMNVQIQFPGSRSYGQVGEPKNAADFVNVEGANIVKISGPLAACEAAVEELKRLTNAAPVEAITSTVSVPLKYHHAISQQGSFFQTLRAFGVQVEQSQHPSQAAVPSRPISTATTPARIDETEDQTPADDILWEVIPNYEGAEGGDSKWTLKARDQAGLERAQKLVEDAIDHAQRMSHVGFLTLPDRSVFPRIVGSKGSNVARLRNETGADITVSRENNTIVIIGAESDMLSAKAAIIKIVSNFQRRSQY